MPKCSKCRSADMHAAGGDNYSCVTCGHTGVPAPAPTPVEKPRKPKAAVDA